MPVTFNQGSSAHYEAVIKDLERQRDQIDKLIESLRAFAPTTAVVDKSAPVSANTAANGPNITTVTTRPLTAMNLGEYSNMTIVDAAKEVLERAGHPLNNAAILAALEAGGLHTASNDPLNTIGSILNRRFQKEGDIIRVGRGTFALAEWAEQDNTIKPDGEPELTEDEDSPWAPIDRPVGF